MSLQSTELELKLISRIEREGPVTFRDFMWSALYDPELGYYNTERLKIGRDGDFYTSSNVHPAFGAMLARAFVGLSQEAEKQAETSGAAPILNRPLVIVEAGAGTGQLACDILTGLREEFPAAFERLHYVIAETSAPMRARQREKLGAFEDRVRWAAVEELEREPLDFALVFSNELVDAMPVHRVRLGDGRLEEQYVTAADRSGRLALALAWGGPSTKALEDYLNRCGVKLRESQIAEINLDATAWLSRITGTFHQGFLVTIDYGDLAGHLYAPDRAGGTLRSFYRHRLIESPLERVGEQDITASVNFSALIEYGRDFGLQQLSYERQASFLLRMGLIERIAAMERAGAGLALRDILAIKNLFVPGGVSDNFRVLVQRRDRE
ncbi:MAG TPA: SAM-dependent methyltransferase [Blastocatellia bacterium]|jgi:SAM-dependent MidA family methyltransferase|nr:SAM-dependent methyltransferase [Blastocatellia bacterium]